MLTSESFVSGFVIWSASGSALEAVHTYFNELVSKFVSVTFTCVVWLLAGVVFVFGLNVTCGFVLSKLNVVSDLITVVFPASSSTYIHK